MIRKDPHIDRLFRQGLKGYKSQAPVHAWDRLSGDLDRKEARKKWFLLSRIAAVLLILLAFGGGYFLALYQNRPQTGVQATYSFDNTYQGIAPGEGSGIAIEHSTINNSGLISTEGDMNNGNPSITGTGIAHHDGKLAENNLGNLLNQGQDQNNSKAPALPAIPGLPVKSHLKLPVTNSVLVPDIIGSATEIAGNISTTNGEEDLSGLEWYGLEEKSNGNNWHAGLSGAPVYAYRDISLNYDMGRQNAGVVDQLNESEEGIISYAAGLDVDFKLGQKWELATGVGYSRIGQTNYAALNFEQQGKSYLLFSISTSTGEISFDPGVIPENIRIVSAPKDSLAPEIPQNISVEQYFDLIEIPLRMRYYLVNNKFMMSFSGGLSPAVVAGNKSYLRYNSEQYKLGQSSNLNPVLFNSVLGIGMGYKINKNLSIRLEPTFKYALNPLNRENSVFYHPWSLSWYTGIRLAF
ncbi:MAG: hypothetical protein Kow00127_04580 [Bacteroidales bacterium]